jgi:hypothetical protein
MATDTKELRRICEAAQPFNGSPTEWFWIGETMAAQYTPSVAEYFVGAIKNLPALVDELDAARAELERIQGGGFTRFPNGMSVRNRCAPCYRSGNGDEKFGLYCHRCGSRETLT